MIVGLKSSSQSQQRTIHFAYNFTSLLKIYIFLKYFQRVRRTVMALIVPENAESVTLDKFVTPSLGNVAGDVRQATAGPGVTKVGGDPGHRGML